MYDLVVRGGMVITPGGPRLCDVGVTGGVIAAMDAELTGGKEEIDAHGWTVFPGVIDVHLHFNEPGRTHWEGAAMGSRALAAGGGTVFFDMPLNSSPCTVGRAEFEQKRLALEHASITDFAVWGGIVPGNREALAELAECGAIGFKAFMSDSGLGEFPRADDVTLWEGMREAARLDLPVSVHAESDEITRTLAVRCLKEGRTGVLDYLDSRPVIAEVEAIQRAALLARDAGARLHIVHVSSGRGVAAALEARAQGTDISIETCPHYLFFTDEDMERIGALAKCAPPLRSEADRQELWRRLHEGGIDIVASDHSPAPPSMKEDGNFFKVWGGIAGVQSTLGVLLDAARGLSHQRVAEVTATNPAKRFGLEGRGRLEVGCRADFAMVDTRVRYTLEGPQLQQRHQMSPYVGRVLYGRVWRTVLNGEVIYDGLIRAQRGGKFIGGKHAQPGTHT
ncbi:MAG: allantoinase AllB [Acidobacteria bacterium]|nr:allantoinase AllB [Acidobacteriota bacterium]